MLPGIYDLEVYRGDTLRRNFQLWQDAAQTVPVDLTGATPAAQIRARRESTEVLLSMECAITPPNSIAIAINAPTTAGMTGKAYWDLQLTYTNGDVSTVVGGAVTFKNDVTRL